MTIQGIPSVGPSTGHLFSLIKGVKVDQRQVPGKPLPADLAERGFLFISSSLPSSPPCWSGELPAEEIRSEDERGFLVE
jgi:hypothetical protein